MTRSSAERELRDAVVARMRLLRPGSRLCHEINVAGQGTNRIDLLAVGVDELIAIEIKSEKDKMGRAPKQIVAMKSVAHHTIVALHECHLVEETTNEWAATHSRVSDRELCHLALPHEVHGATAWVYPEAHRGLNWGHDVSAWKAPALKLERVLPTDAIHMLWREELAQMCGGLRVSVGKRANMTDMVLALSWHCTGREITRGICSALRRRKMIEADEPLQMVAA